MRVPFGDIRPNYERTLELGDGCIMAYSESGNEKGLPLFIIHGGPGAGVSDYSRKLFNPEIYRIIQFDQRGCGKSVPHCTLENNNSFTLVEDIKALYQHLNIEQAVLYGGSWGVTLALLFTQSYPGKVLGLILRGSFLARQQDMGWLYDGGAGRIFPDHWHKFTRFVGGKTGYALIEAYHDKLTGGDELHRMAAAKQWSIWEAQCATLLPNPYILQSANDPKSALPFALIATHFMKNNCFIEPNQILQNMADIEHLPGFIVHGRYDMVCPLDNAYDLYSVWQNSELDIVREAGHSDLEPGIADAVIKAGSRMAQRLGISPIQA